MADTERVGLSDSCSYMVYNFLYQTAPCLTTHLEVSSSCTHQNTRQIITDPLVYPPIIPLVADYQTTFWAWAAADELIPVHAEPPNQPEPKHLLVPHQKPEI